MAGILASLYTPSEVACVAATPKTVLQLTAPTNQRLMVKRWGVFFDGVTPTNEPVVVKLIKQSTAGTATSQSPVILSAGSETLQATGNYNATVEPTTTAVLDILEIHPQQGWMEFVPLDQGLPIVGGGRLGINITAPANVNCVAKFIYEE